MDMGEALSGYGKRDGKKADRPKEGEGIGRLKIRRDGNGQMDKSWNTFEQKEKINNWFFIKCLLGQLGCSMTL